MKQVTSVITTINYPSEAIKKIAYLTDLIIVADEKTPKDWFHKVSQFIGTGCKKEFAPYNHYARKNLGYLAAIANGAQTIYDTDDDNIPNENWKQRTVEVKANESETKGWFNAYDTFIGRFIWPRGFSLKEVYTSAICSYETHSFTSSIQQGLSDGEPDVDAIWRLILNNTNKFDEVRSVYLKPGAWCPFNSQSTWWFPKAYPLMYLPVTASFRMTDIWRSFVAQRCLWEMGEGVTFHSPAEVYQDRNKHDLLKDFEDEIPGYLLNDKIVKLLQGINLNGDIFKNLHDCYFVLTANDIMPTEEMSSLNAWIKDVQKVWKP